MSKTVDERVVQMQFDNADFERRVNSTMSLLDKLKASLKLDGSSFGALGKATSGFSLEGMDTAINQTAGKFSMLEVAAITAISNITNSVVNAGKRMVSEFTIKPVTDGFSEYKLKLNSVQTIMAGTGATVEDVTEHLNKLNEYSDRTIYSFSDMTSNIGKFTNAGVKLDDAVSAIQGVANVAAISGANANEASRAMYNFSQAISMNKVQAIDWKSIELANMGTKDFKQNLIDTAVAMGTLQEAEEGVYVTASGNEVATNNFTEALKDEWLNADVLRETLTNYSSDVRRMTKEEKANYIERLKGIGYTDDQIKRIIELGQKATDAATEVKSFSQLMDTVKESIGSGWAETFEIIFGDFEEAKALWTRVNNVIDPIIGKFSDMRNNFLYAWDEAGGRTATIETIANVFKSIASVLRPISKAFGEVFKPLKGETLANVAKVLEKITSKLIVGEKVGKGIHAVAKAIFTVLGAPLKLAGALIGGIVVLVQKLYSAGVNLGTKLKPVFEKILYYIDEIVETLQAGFEESGLAESFQKIVDSFTKIFGKLKEIFDDIFGGILGGFSPSADKLVEKVKEIAGTIEGFIENHIWPALDDLSTILNDGADALVEFFDSFDIDKEAIITTISGALDKLAESVGKFFGSINEKRLSILDSIGSKFGKIADIFSRAKEKIKTAVDQIREKFAFMFEGLELKDIENAINSGVLTGFVIAIFGVLKQLKKLLKNFNKGSETFQEVLSQLGDSLQEFSSTLKNKVKVDMIGAIAKAILVLVGSLLVLSLIPPDKLAISTGVLFALMFALSALSSSMADAVKGIDVNNYLKFAGSMAIMAASILIVAAALKKVASADQANLGTAFVIITILIAEMVHFSKQLTSMPTAVVDAQVFTSFATAIYIISRAIRKLGKMKTEDLVKGSTAVSVLMAVMTGIIVGMTYAFKKFEMAPDFNAASIVATFIGLAIALDLLVPILTTITLLTKLTGGSGIVELIVLAAGLAGLAAALGYVSQAVGGRNLAAGAASIVVLAVALNLLVPPLLILSALPFKVIMTGLGAVVAIIGALLAVMLVAGAISTAFSTGLVALGTAFLFTGAGVTLLAVGLTLLGPALIAASAGIVAFAGAMVAARELIANAIAMLIGGISLGIQRSADALVNGFGVLILALVRALERYGGEVIAAFIGFLAKLANEMANRLPMFVAIAINAINMLADTIRVYSDPLLYAVENVMASIGMAIIEAFRKMVEPFLRDIPLIGDKLADGLDGAVQNMEEAADEIATKAGESLEKANERMQQEKDAIAQTSGDIGQTMVDNMESTTSGTGGKIGDGLVDTLVGSIKGGTGDVENAAGGLGDALDISAIAGENGKIASMEEITSLVGGLQDGTGSVEDVMEQLQNGMTIDGEVTYNNSYDAASQSTQGAVDAINDGAPSVEESFAKLRMNNMQEDFYADGQANMSSYSSGVIDSKDKVKTAVKNMTRSALSGTLDAKEKLKTEGASAGDNYAKGLSSKGSKAYTTGSEVTKRGAKGVEDTRWKFEEAGKYVGDGLISGMRIKIPKAYAAGYDMGKEAVRGTKAVPQVQSPSKATYKIGMYIGEGLINGIYKMIGGVGKAGEELGRESVKSLGDATTRMANMLATDFDGYSPRVTPVLDLSNVNRQMGTLDSMFGSRTIGLAGGINQVYTPNSLLATSLDDKFDGLAKALSGNTDNGTNNWYINVDGATNPEEFADRLVRRIKMKTRTAYG